jgi:tetratricopeptide (TPR) repeat protein
MQNARSLRRTLFLTLSLLSACAAAEPTGAAVGVRRHIGYVDSSGGAGAFLAGRFAGTQGDLDFATDEFLKALRVDPTNVELQQQAFLAGLLTGRPEAARLAQQQLDNPTAQLLLGDLEARNGNWEQAEARFAALPRQGLTEILRPLLVAWAEAGGGHPDTALATLRPYVEGGRFRGVFAMHAALIADLAFRTAEAGRLYATAQREFGGLNLQFGRILASWQARQGQSAEAARTLQAAAETVDDLAIVLPQLQANVSQRVVRRPTDGMAEVYLALAAALRQEDSSAFAGVLLHLALDLRPDLTTARLLCAEIVDSGKHPEAALQVLEPVPDDDPLAPLVQLRRAELEDRLGDTEAALHILDDLAARFPNRPEPWALQGDILRQKHRYTEAVAAYDKAVAAVPRPTQGNWPLFYDRGIALERSHHWPRAEADFQQALTLAPEQPFVLNYLAYSWTELGENLPQARQMLERAVQLRPNDGALVDSLGWVELAQGNVAGGVKTLEKAVELAPEDATVNGHLGDAYWKAGRKLEAQYQWRRALSLNPDSDEVPKLEAKLRDVEPAQGMPAGAAPTQVSKALP